MEIYPHIQAKMFFGAFALGLGAGVLRLLLLVLRTALGAYLPAERMRAHYERPLPLLHRAPGYPKQRARKWWRIVVAFVGDVLFCLFCAAEVLLLLYEYNDGAWRLSVPVLFLIGLAVFRLATAHVGAWLNDWLAYALSALFLYVRTLVRLPLRGVWWVLRHALWTPVKKGCLHLIARHRRRVSEKLCRAQLALAARGLITKERMTSDVEKKDHPDAMDHQDPDRAAVLRGSGHRFWPFA